jgi:hypothetical protein
MILTQILVVMCTLDGTQCTNYLTVTQGILSASACQRAIQDFARNQTATDAVLNHERSSCTLMPVNTQNDLPA